MRVDVATSPTFRELVACARDVVMAAYEHGEVPILHHVPSDLLRINVNYLDNDQSPAIGLESVRWYTPPRGARRGFTMPYDLLLWIRDGREVALNLAYGQRLMRSQTAASFLNRYVASVRWLSREPDAALSLLWTKQRD